MPIDRLATLQCMQQSPQNSCNLQTLQQQPSRQQAPFNQQHYEYYQKCAADYKSRQEKLRQDGMYILTIKNHR